MGAKAGRINVWKTTGRGVYVLYIQINMPDRHSSAIGKFVNCNRKEDNFEFV